ncbi:MAG TPA: FumA C-terminus/TtdB family hydratase beta subunit [Methanomassiliicoccales archaeon]|nr:FumA C-terminus/TtdB family hydratase beta subunit [Methanomassiliicoccales archaeon]
MKARKIRSPMSEGDARSLRAGDIVSLSGELLTARDEAHLRILELLRSGLETPFRLEGMAIYHCGPIMRKDGVWKVVAAGPTTSARLDRLAPEVIRKCRPRLLIGKGGMSAETLEAMKEVGCAYLAFPGGAAVLAAEAFPEVLDVHWEDLGMPEAVWRLRADNFGPLVVAMDSHGRSLFKEVEDKVKERSVLL